MVVTSNDTGLKVVTEDGALVGQVRDVSGSYFKVDAPLKRDFWLDGSLVKAREDGRLTLDISREELGSVARAEPGLEPAGDPMREIVSAPVIAEEELLEQRARMEAELAEQSRNLPPHEPSVTQQRGPRPYEKIPGDHAAFQEHAGTYVPNHAVLRYDEMMAEERAASGRRRLAWLAVFAGTVGVLGAVGYAAYRRRRRPSVTEQLLERGAELVRRPDFSMRGLKMVPRLLRDVAARAK